MKRSIKQIALRAVAATACMGAHALPGANSFAVSPNADQATRMYNRIAGVPPAEFE